MFFFFVEANAEYWQTELPAMFASLWHPGSNVTSPGLAVGLSEGRIPPLKWHPEAGSSMFFVQGCCGYPIAAARASPKWLWRPVGQWQWDQNVPTCDVRAVFKVVLPVYCQFCYFARLLPVISQVFLFGSLLLFFVKFYFRFEPCHFPKKWYLGSGIGGQARKPRCHGVMVKPGG